MNNNVDKKRVEYPVFSYKPTFGGLYNSFEFEQEIVKMSTGKDYQGYGLYDDKGYYIDWKKVGWENLKNEPIDWENADEDDIAVFWHALSLAETNDTTWVRRYNKFNVTKPLAVFHSLTSEKARESFGLNLKELANLRVHKSLDIPVMDKNGRFNMDCCVFDTETTGVNIYPGDRLVVDDENYIPKTLDKIIQIGAIQVKDGQVVPDTAYDQYINPEMPIPAGATAVHHITDEMVEDAPTVEAVLKKFVDGYLNKKNGPIVAYNSKFDITILNNAIKEHNKHEAKLIKQKKMFKVLDPFILIQRIHPYLGARKRLTEQYKFLFGQDLEGAHDAFVDVKATVDVLKYCIYWIDKHRVDKTKPLTLREVLYFQNGGKVKNLDIPLDKEGANSKVNFDESYRLAVIRVSDFHDGYKLSKSDLEDLRKEIGSANVESLRTGNMVEHLIKLEDEQGNPINPRETASIPAKNKHKGTMINAPYVLEKNFKKVLDLIGVEGYADKSKEEVIDLITDKAKHYIKEGAIDIWMKNPNPYDIDKGNDLPDIEISRKVMEEKLM